MVGVYLKMVCCLLYILYEIAMSQPSQDGLIYYLYLTDDDDVTSISRWLACMYRSLDEFQHDETILDSLKAFKMLPLSDGRLVSLNEMTVFFPIMKNLERQKNKGSVLMFRPLVKSASKKNIFLISQPKHMLWVLIRTISMRLFF